MRVKADRDAVRSWYGVESRAAGALAAAIRSVAAARSAEARAAVARSVKLRGDTALPLPFAAAEARVDVVVIAMVERMREKIESLYKLWVAEGPWSRPVARF